MFYMMEESLAIQYTRRFIRNLFSFVLVSFRLRFLWAEGDCRQGFLLEKIDSLTRVAGPLTCCQSEGNEASLD